MLVPNDANPRQTCRGRIRLKIVWDHKEKDKVRQCELINYNYKTKYISDFDLELDMFLY